MIPQLKHSLHTEFSSEQQTSPLHSVELMYSVFFYQNEKQSQEYHQIADKKGGESNKK